MIYYYFTVWIDTHCKVCKNKKICEKLGIFCCSSLFAFLEKNRSFNENTEIKNFKKEFEIYLKEE